MEIKIKIKRFICLLFFKFCAKRLIESHKSLLVLMHFNQWGESGWALINKHLKILSEYDPDGVVDVKETVENFRLK